MPKLIATIDSDGWAIVRDGEALIFVQPPFDETKRQGAFDLGDQELVAIGYTLIADAPEESWQAVADRIRGRMETFYVNLPPVKQQLERLLRYGPPSVLEELIKKIENVWLPRMELKAAQRALNALGHEKRVIENVQLRERVLKLEAHLEALTGGKKVFGAE